MHILFLHQNFPAQFGHIAAHLVQHHGFRCTFLSEQPAGNTAGIERIQYQVRSGASQQTHYCSRTFENQVWHSQAAFDAMRARPDIRPDLIVGHSGFVSSLYLRELYDCPIINYFEYFYRTKNSDLDFRKDLPGCETQDLLRARTRNAMLLLDLENCNLGYSPTYWQREQLPREFHAKLNVVFDGIDTSVWRPLDAVDRRIGGWIIPADMKVVTYVSRGMEAMRGFDIFMEFARRLCELRSDVLFLVVGEDRVAYGGDSRYTGGKTFKQWVLERGKYDLDRILFLGRIMPAELVKVFTLSDLHVYLTAPFVLSWSLMNALACGATILASDTAPVREMIQHGWNGLLVDFFDIEAMVQNSLQVLAEPEQYAALGTNGMELIHDRYSLQKCLPQMLKLYESAVSR